MKNPESGFDPLLEERMRLVLPLCAARRIKIVTNLGAANPEGAVKKATEIARSLDLSSLKIAAVVGDHVLEAYKERDLPIMEFDGSIRQLGNRLLSANAYLGVEPMAQALNGGADVVITGRASDPALFLAPMMHDFGWATDDWNLLGQLLPDICWNALARSPAAILPIRPIRTYLTLRGLGFRSAKSARTARSL
jgi:hypothetical protein